jgi:transcriptional regulator with XRE-family HTH domain
LAKIKVRPHPGALSALLSEKAMTQVDAAAATGVDRKTLARIDRGEEVKLETLQRVATRLKQPINVFEPPTTESPDKDDREWPPLPWMESVMLRGLSVELLSQLLKTSIRIRWELNLNTVDEKAREFLEKFELAVQEFQQHLITGHAQPDQDDRNSLRFQLSRLKKGQDVAALMEQFANYRLTVLGADYLFWEYTQGFIEFVGGADQYRSSRVVLLSVEPYGTQARRVYVDIGEEPPKVAPKSTTVLVDGVPLKESEDDRQIKHGVEDDIPF